MKRTVTGLLVALLLSPASLSLAPVLVPAPAEAVVGRPLTPVSVAGVSRRTARRTTRRVAYRRPFVPPVPVAGAVVAGAAMTATAVAIGTTFASRPSGCREQAVGGITYLSCDGTWFQPQMQGGQVVYTVVAPPG